MGFLFGSVGFTCPRQVATIRHSGLNPDPGEHPPHQDEVGDDEDDDN